jgi:hypothetical protein
MRKFLLILAALLMLSAWAPFSFAAADPAVTIVSPPENEAIVTNNFLISIKTVQAGKTLKISASELQLKSGDKWVSVKPEELEDFDKKGDDEKRLSPIMEPETFESRSSMNFYTKKLEDITPGVYVILVETVDASGKVLYSKEARILVKEKAEEEAKVFETPKSGTSQFLQNLLSKIFKN